MQRQLIQLLRRLKLFLSTVLKKYDSKLPYFITSVITASLVIGGVKLFIELTEVLKSEYLSKFDTTISNTVQAYRAPLLTKYFVFITNIGDAIGYAVVFCFCTFLFYVAFKSWK